LGYAAAEFFSLVHGRQGITVKWMPCCTKSGPQMAGIWLFQVKKGDMWDSIPSASLTGELGGGTRGHVLSPSLGSHWLMPSGDLVL